MADVQDVDLWFDPICPWAWMTSRWLLEVEKVRPIKVQFHVMSLAVLNENRDLEPEYRRHMDFGWGPARVAIAIEQQFGAEKLAEWYDAIGTRFHPQDEEREPATVEKSLSDVGLPTDLVAAMADGDLDPALRKSHYRAIESVGDEVGTPVIRINDRALFGPVISPAPKGEEAGRLFDGVSLVTAYEGFFELKRTRTVGPIFN